MKKIKIKMWLENETYWAFVDKGTASDKLFVEIMKRRGILKPKKISKEIKFKKGTEQYSVSLRIVKKIEELVKEYCGAMGQYVSGRFLIPTVPSILVLNTESYREESTFVFIIAPQELEEDVCKIMRVIE